jgi:hypothetical protein
MDKDQPAVRLSKEALLLSVSAATALALAAAAAARL